MSGPNRGQPLFHNSRGQPLATFSLDVATYDIYIYIYITPHRVGGMVCMVLKRLTRARLVFGIRGVSLAITLDQSGCGTRNS